MLRRVLVTTDFSDCSRSAFPTVRELQRVLPAEITLVHVCEGGQSREDALRELGALRREHFEGLPVTLEALPPGEGISSEVTRYAVTHSASLIVTATHGRSGLDRIRYGSVTERLLAESKSPVFVVPHHFEKESLAPKSASAEATHIAVVTDLAPESDRALLFAGELLRAYGSQGARLVVLHVAENMLNATFGNSLGENPEAVRAELERSAESRLEELVQTHLRGTTAMTYVIRGSLPVYEELVRYTDVHHLDLIVLARHEKSVVERLLTRDISTHLVRFSRKKLLVIPEGCRSLPAPTAASR